MDIPCPRCGEPCDVHDLETDASPEERRRFMTGQGCEACFGECVGRPLDDQMLASAVILDLLGSDLDGAAAFLEDLVD
jgi:hypothetical protein